MAVMQAEDVVEEERRSAGLIGLINSPVAVCAGAAEGRLPLPLPLVWEKEAAPEVRDRRRAVAKHRAASASHMGNVPRQTSLPRASTPVQGPVPGSLLQ
jgi:hypothetical protein